MHTGTESSFIPSWVATLLSIFYTLIYVLPFYLSPRTRPSPTLNRDAPRVIAARIRTVSAAAIFTTLSTFYLILCSRVAESHSSKFLTALHLLGYYPITPLTFSITRPFLLTALLFLGPLFERVATQPSWPKLSSIFSSPTFSDPIWFRNYIAGPVTEEVLFRSVIIPLHILANVSTSEIIWVTPLFFGIAHIHHLYELTLTNPRTPLLPAVLRSLFQFTYTTVFGWYAAFLYLRTGSLPLVILVHSFCNWSGFPRFWGRLEIDDYPVPTSSPLPTVSISANITFTHKGKADHVQTPQAKSNELPITLTIAYYVLLCLGAYGFSALLWTLTESPTALRWDL